MAVVIETTLGDLTVDLFIEHRPRTCLNFLKLCKLKYYNYNLFHMIQHGFIAQTGDPTGEGNGGQSVWGVLEGPSKSFFGCEKMPKIKHTELGLLSMVTTDDGMVGSQFFFTLAPDLDSLDNKHCVIGQVMEGHDILRLMNDVICDTSHRPYQDVRITHTVVLEDPFDDPRGLKEPSRSPSPSKERLAGGRIAPDEEIDDMKGKTEEEIQEMIEEREARARATILEIVGDLPDADMAPPENVLFVCKLNPVTNDDDLEIIFSRFGKIKCCEVIRDKKTGDSLQYAFIEFEDKKSCEDAYFKMDNVLIDDRRIHVDFSQSVSKIKWRGKGRGVIINDDEPEVKNGKNEQRNQNRNELRKYDRYDKIPSNDRYKSDNNRRDKYDRHNSRNDYLSQNRSRNRTPEYRRRGRSPDRSKYRDFKRNSPDKYRQKPQESSLRHDYRNSRDIRYDRNNEHRKRYEDNGRRRSIEKKSNRQNERNKERDVSDSRSKDVKSKKRKSDDESPIEESPPKRRKETENRSKHDINKKYREDKERKDKHKSKKVSKKKKKQDSSSDSSSSDSDSDDSSDSSVDVKKKSKKKISKKSKSSKSSKKVQASSSSSTDSSSSSDTTNSDSDSDSGHEKRRTKNKNKKSVREKSEKKKKR